MRTRTGLIAICATALIVVIPLSIQAIGWRQSYLLQVYSLIPIWILGGLSLTIITGYVGEVSLAQVALMGIGSYTSAILSTHGVPIVLSVISGLCTSVIGALALGIPTLRLRGPYFVVCSMAFNGIFYEIVNSWIEVTRGPNGINGVPSYGRMGVLSTYLPWFCAGVCLVGVWLLGCTRLGKSMMATRDDDLAARAIGLRVFSIKAIAFGLSGLIAGIAGILLAHQIGYVSPEFYTIDQSVFLLTLALLGGVRRPEGAGMGAIIMILAQELLRRFAQLQLLFYGTTMLMVILFLPDGVTSLFNRANQEDQRAYDDGNKQAALARSMPGN